MGSTLNTDRQWQVGLRLLTNLSRDPASGKWPGKLIRHRHISQRIP